MRVMMMGFLALMVSGCESPAEKAEQLVARIVATPADWARPGHKQTVIEAKDELIKLGPAALPAIIDGLGDDNRFVGMWLLEPILASGESAVLPLAAALTDADVDRRRWALFAISGLASKEIDISAALPAIQRCTRDEDSEIRALSLMAISSTKEDRGVPEFISALKDPDAHVRSEAAKWLGIVATVRVPGARLQDDPLPQLSESVIAEIRPKLIAAFSDESAIVRREVVGALSEYGPSVEPTLREAMKDRDAEVRAAALESLACIRSDGAVAELIEGLGDPDIPVRLRSAKWLGMLADPDTLLLSRRRPSPLPTIDPLAFEAAIDSLTTASKDAHAGVRSAASDALKKIGR
ncbi:HEAT repeat domain-containing protein [Aporhodopirellula aestuarii]|uniref:HEAT repeat domain-containing protein n=1 Tax=Aporhodopirellula aestuarii TaxID=2950107 RepID=A0ABT0U5S1_9BACT|nr:HEAT repeat domain-containing protein [Aporhodopirellula aestuarii]MCM2371890.1 HEAT repeat domain-containing protein [Aporhodopirellula aestuarii]